MNSMGEISAGNCDDFGWEPIGPVDPSLVAETAQDSNYGFGRAWSRSSKYSLRSDPRTLFLVHTVEGGFDFTVENDVIRTNPGQLVVFDGRAAIQADTVRETARYVWFFRPKVLRPGKELLDFHEPITLDNGPMQSLTSMTNALLNAAASASPEAHSHIGQAMEFLLLAALTEQQPHREVHSMHRDGLFTAAQFVISQHFRDPGFGVNELVKELSSHRSSVHRVFSSMGTSPRREIERYRLEEVDKELRHATTLDEIVTNAGFTSVRQYKVALMRSNT